MILSQPLTIVTGLPGHGKTLFTITALKEEAKKAGRQVYYSGIPEVKIPGWVEIEDGEEGAKKWFEAPAGSIIVIDEAQRIFRPRSFGSQVPEYVKQLETLRHRGFNLILITQHPGLIDSNVRKLAGMHFHSVRKWGTEGATIHKFHSVRDNVDKNRKDSEKLHWKFDKSSYGLYKSAEVHTVKRSIPMKLWLLVIVPILLVFLIYYVVHYAYGLQHPEENSKGQTSSGTVTRNDANTQQPKLSYVDAHVPQLAGLGFTAPAYEEVIKPKRAPYPAACATMKGECRCYTQDGTRISEMPVMTCQSIVQNGFFADWIDPVEERRKEQEILNNRQQANAEMMRASAPPAPPVVVMAPQQRETSGSGKEPETRTLVRRAPAAS